ncbi:MAG TPA: manganese efflux pump MntP family protein [Mariniphaga sp.]|nr:manganese efflux pump MntP family protein [Mariniphaga sp.]
MTFSQLIVFLLLGTGLSFDSFAVSVSCGLIKKQITFKEAIPIASSLAIFQALSPVIGWYAGNYLHQYIGSFDHWVAFSLLAFIGYKMVVEGKNQDENTRLHSLSPRIVLGLSVATSIDALAVGLSFGVLEMSILYPVLIIGLITFLASMLGMLWGRNISGKRCGQSLLIGGMVLAAIGLKILIEHIWFA